MSNPRRRLLSAMIRGYFGSGPVPHDSLDVVRPGLLAALDEVEPLIRADERERIGDLMRTYEQEVRERIAQALEAHVPAPPQPADIIWMAAATIARNGGVE